MNLPHTISIYAGYAAGYDTIRVIAVDFQLHLQYGCNIYCGAASAAICCNSEAQNAVGMQYMLQVQCMLQFRKGLSIATAR